MKKLLLFAFYIFSSAAILPCDGSAAESKALDEEMYSLTLKLEQLDKEKKHEGLKQEMRDGLYKAFTEGAFFLSGVIAQEEFVPRISAIHQKMMDDQKKLGEDGKSCNICWPFIISISLVSSEETRRSEEGRLAKISEEGRLAKPEEFKRRRLEELKRELTTKLAYAEEEKKKAEERNQLSQQNSEMLKEYLDAVFAYVVTRNTSLDDLVKRLSANRERFVINQQILNERHNLIARMNVSLDTHTTIVDLPASLPAQHGNAVFAYVVTRSMSLDDLVKTLSDDRVHTTIVDLPASLPAQAVVSASGALPAQHGQEQCSCLIC
jgi:hypothetical protein